MPKGWRPKGRNYKTIGKAAKETTFESDWDDYGWEHTVEVQGVAVVKEKEALQYLLFEVKPESPQPNPELRNAVTPNLNPSQNDNSK